MRDARTASPTVFITAVLMLTLASGSVGLLGGCQYSTERPFSQDYRTICVEMFQSKEFRRGLEFRLTEALVKRIEIDTPYRIATKARADVLISGEILKVENRSLGDDFDTDLPREIGSTVVIRFRVQDLRSGEMLVERERFVYQASYIPPVGESFDEGMLRAMDGLAEQIVATLESDW
jgi:hypothetical protein